MKDFGLSRLTDGLGVGADSWPTKEAAIEAAKQHDGTIYVYEIDQRFENGYRIVEKAVIDDLEKQK